MNLNKELSSGQAARDKIVAGANVVADAVKVTFGPKGRNVVIEKGLGFPVSTKDGVSVAKEVYLKDKFMNLGAQMIKQVAMKSADTAGDGTTASTVLAQSLFSEGNRLVASQLNPAWIKRGMEKACGDVIEKLKKVSSPVKSNLEIKQIATISANGDEIIGEHIAKAMEKVGEHGVVTVGEANGLETELEYVEGMVFDRGLITPYLMTDTEKYQAVYENCYILLINKKVSSFEHDLKPILEKAVSQDCLPLTIIAEDFLGDSLQLLVQNRLRGGLQVAAVKAPGYGSRRTDLLEDIAVIIGGEVVSEDKGYNLKDIDVDVFGLAGKIQIKQFETIITDGKGDPEKIHKRIDLIKGQIEVLPGEFDRQNMQERLCKLTGGVAVIKVGGATELEIKERKDRLDDAIAATKSAVEEGIVPGGGIALYRISQEIAKSDSDNREYDAGYNLVLHACEAPIRQILANAGVDNVEKILSNISQQEKITIGYDARNDKIVDMIQHGIIDPTKVVRCALENAVSVASLMITTETLIVSEEQPTTATGCNH